MGVVTEVTIKCVERHKLEETTSVMTREEVKANHYALLRDKKHVRSGTEKVHLPFDISTVQSIVER